MHRSQFWAQFCIYTLYLQACQKNQKTKKNSFANKGGSLSCKMLKKKITRTYLPNIYVSPNFLFSKPSTFWVSSNHTPASMSCFGLMFCLFRLSSWRGRWNLGLPSVRSSDKQSIFPWCSIVGNWRMTHLKQKKNKQTRNFTKSSYKQYFSLAIVAS